LFYLAQNQGVVLFSLLIEGAVIEALLLRLLSWPRSITQLIKLNSTSFFSVCGANKNSWGWFDVEILDVHVVIEQGLLG